MSAKQELTDLTVCRAVFAAWVFTYHVDLYLDFSRFLGPFADLIRHGYLGVDGFFILSGLILARVHDELIGNLRKHWRTKYTPKFLPPSRRLILRFWGKRLARIYPVHLATIVILAILVGFGLLDGLAPHDPSRFSLRSLVQNLLLVQGWGGSAHGTWNYPSWSVSTEWAGYLVFPFVWYLIVYFGQLVATQIMLLSFIALGLIFATNGYSLNLAFTDGFWRFVPEFLIGMGTARIVDIWADFGTVRRVGIKVGFILFLFSAAIGVDLAAVVGIWLILLSFLAQADAQQPPILGQRAALNWLGRRSYAFYMSFAIAELLMCQYFGHNHWSPKAHAVWFAFGMLAITLVLAVSLYTLVETPCRRFADRKLAQSAEAKPKQNTGKIFPGKG